MKGTLKGTLPFIRSNSTEANNVGMKGSVPFNVKGSVPFISVPFDSGHAHARYEDP